MAEKVVIEGIQQSGGRIEADVLAVGRNAKAEKVVQDACAELNRKQMDEVADGLEKLLEALKTHGGELDNADEIAGATERVAAELKEPQPNKLTLNALLAGIAEGSKSVTAIAKAASALGALIGSAL